MNAKKCINCHSNILLAIIVLMTTQGARADLWGTISSGFQSATHTLSGALGQAEHAAQQIGQEAAAKALSNARGTLQDALQHIRVSHVRPTAPRPLPEQTAAKINIFDPTTFPTGTERYNNIAYVFAIPANPSSVFTADTAAIMNSVARNNQALIVNVPGGAPFSLVRLDDNGNPINIDGSQPTGGTLPTVASFDTSGERILAADGQAISYLLVPALPSNSAAFLNAVNNLLNGSTTELAKSIYLFEPGCAYVYMRLTATYEDVVTAPGLMMASTRGVITPAPSFPGEPGTSTF